MLPCRIDWCLSVLCFWLWSWIHVFLVPARLRLCVPACLRVSVSAYLPANQMCSFQWHKNNNWFILLSHCSSLTRCEEFSSAQEKKWREDGQRPVLAVDSPSLNSASFSHCEKLYLNAGLKCSISFLKCLSLWLQSTLLHLYVTLVIVNSCLFVIFLCHCKQLYLIVGLKLSILFLKHVSLITVHAIPFV